MSGAQSLVALLQGFDVPAPDAEITGLATDSRRVRAGDLFLACQGRGTHALAHLDQALERGAAAVVWEPAPGLAAPALDIPAIAVPKLSERLGEIAARFNAQPSREMFCAGVTGTDGKTSTAYLLTQACAALGQHAAYVGTLGSGRLDALRPATHTTPDALSLQARIAELRDEGVNLLAMEVSSHALDQHRVAGVEFDVAILTNITRDHLDYHGTLAHYVASKRRLFEHPGLRAAVLNRDDEYGARWARELGIPCLVYGIEGEPPAPGDWLIARDVQTTGTGIRCTVHAAEGSVEFASTLLGRFNVYNALAVLGALRVEGVPLQDAARALETARTVPGRIEGFRGPLASPLVVVDYAHTPEALRQLLGAVRAHTKGRLICVFGCGGDRDRGKRPLMGAAAAELADAIVVTDDNPRSEDPQSIVEDILAGVPEVAEGCRFPIPDSRPFVIHDRAEAIRHAVGIAGADDVVVVAGKGHETTQTYSGEVRAFSDRHFVATLLGAPAPRDFMVESAP